jgi:hypothetical protein
VRRLERLMAFSLVPVCVITAFSFWATRQPGADARGALSAPPRARAELESLSAGLTTAVNVTPSPDAKWLIRAAAQTGIPARALRAYVAAAATANDSAPMCRIGWNTVAAVGSFESAHGTYGGGSLNTAGQASGALVGPTLDGAGFAAIADSDAGVLDGDARWTTPSDPCSSFPPPGRL